MTKLFKSTSFKIAAGILLVATVASVALSRDNLGNIFSYNYETAAQNVPIHYPASLKEVQSLIKTAAANKVKVRFSGASHSTSSVILGSGIYIKSAKLNQVLGIENDPVHGPVVEVESGVKLGDLANELGQHGYSLGFAYPYYSGLTIGGLLSTGSHGSSRKHTALSSQNIVEMVIVNGLGDVIKLDSKTPELLQAGRVSLGLLGFIYTVKLKIRPDFNIEFTSKVFQGKNAILREAGKVNFGTVADTEYFYWFPKYDRAVKIEGHITDRKEFPGAQSIVLGQKNSGDIIDHISYHALALGKNNSVINKWNENYRFKNLVKSPPPYVYISNGKEVKAQNIVGKSSKMLISKKTPMNPAYTAQDISFSFRIEDAPQVMQFIREFSIRHDFYFPISGIFLRFAHASGQSYLSQIERADGKTNGLYVMAEFFEVKKYTLNDPPSRISYLRKKMLKGLTDQGLISFHWGKNRDEIFSSQANKTLLGNNIQEFEKVRKQMDPNDTFVNSFANEYLF